MDKFEEAICGHNPLYKEGLQDKYYQGAKWAWQSRQAELDKLNKVLVERTKEWLEAIELGTYFLDIAKPLKDEVEEKDKRIESALYALKGLKAENDLWGCDQIEVQIEILEKALRGEQ